MGEYSFSQIKSSVFRWYQNVGCHYLAERDAGMVSKNAEEILLIDLEFTNCIAQISVSNPSFAPFKFVSFEAISTALQDLGDLKLTYFFYDSDGMTEQEVLNELSLGVKFCSSFVPNQLENAYLNKPGRLKIPKNQLRHFIHPDDIQKYEDPIIDSQYVCTGIQAQYLLLTNNLLSIRVLPDAFII